ncbi:divergent polysaccharide deacetylase family protein [Actibacterium lipolyticum]|uniref:Divergent polysaccharide deacetylase n=1 Tax=Actibacterium lipolyticum TaxID=1524263 RepID=A0A238KI64_9RHOB|nr:divergent polysaccharide deacetylase family protein [Actibacterium lipolyticum]SMX42559.1 Divergent polysaccharide deacetylase [Actibacterium lipolyticum]
MSGFVRGLVSGGVTVVVLLSAASIIAPLPQEDQGLVVEVEPNPVGSGSDEEDPEGEPEEPEPGAQAPALERAPAPDAAPTAPEAEAEGAPTESPQTGEIDLPPGSEFNRPPPEGEAIIPGTDQTALPGAAPAVPTPSTDIATPPAPDTAPGSVPQTDAEATGVMVAPDVVDASPTIPSTGEAPILPIPGATSPLEPSTEAQPARRINPTSPIGVAPNIAAEATPSMIRVPVPGHKIALPNVRTGRLPTVGGENAAQQAEESEIVFADPADLDAVARYAAPFEAEGDGPLFSVILIDAGEEGLDRETLKTFSFPVTFAVDASRPDAEQAMRDYRAAGFEVVLLMTGLPEGAQPSDLEVSLSAYLSRVPESVAIMDAEAGTLQSDRPLLTQLMAMLDESGHGVVTYDRGLNTAEKMAQAAKVPSALVFRVLDGEQEAGSTIRRYLDRGAFKAAQDGQVVVVGHSYPETVTALFSWALEGKGADLTMAPISAILRGQ